MKETTNKITKFICVKCKEEIITDWCGYDCYDDLLTLKERDLKNIMVVESDVITREFEPRPATLKDLEDN